MRAIRSVLLIAAIPVALAGCGSSYTSPSTTSGASPGAAASPSTPASSNPTSTGTVVVKSGTATVAGAAMTVLTDAQGQTLYYRNGDGPITITCTGPCAANWPPILLASGTPGGAPGLPGSLTVFVGANGRQVLYNGHPLYLWVKDSAPGQATGQNLAGFKVVTPDIAAAG